MGTLPYENHNYDNVIPKYTPKIEKNAVLYEIRNDDQKIKLLKFSFFLE